MTYGELETVDGIGPAAAKKLREAGIRCVEALAIVSQTELIDRTRLGEGTCEKFIQNARLMLGIGQLRSGHMMEVEDLKKRRLTTGVSKVDTCLRGGIESGSIVEFYGPARGGKTQWCHQLAVNCQLPLSRGGLDGHVLWLDTEYSFKPILLRTMALRMGIDPNEALSGVMALEVVDRDDLLDRIKQLPALVHELEVRLIVIDSLGWFFRLDDEYLDMRRILNKSLMQVFRTLRGVVNHMDCIAVYTNQVFHRFASYSGNPNAPTGGHIMAHGPTHRFYTRRTKEESRKLKLHDNVALPEFDVDVVIGWGGFFDSSQEKRAIQPVLMDYIDSLTPMEQSAKDGELAEEVT